MWCHFELDGAAPGFRCVTPEAVASPVDDDGRKFLLSAAEPRLGFESLLQAIADAAQSGAEFVWVVRNPRLVFDFYLRERLLQSRGDLAEYALASPGGLCLDGARFQSAYSSHAPALIVNRNHECICDTSVDSFVIRAAVLEQAQRELTLDLLAVPEEAFGWAVIQGGYHLGLASAYVPSLAAHVDGPFLVADPDAVRAVAGDLLARVGPEGPLHDLPTWSGTVTVPACIPRAADPASAGRDVYEETIDRLAGQLDLTIVTRTQFKRPHLLERLLTSIEEAMVATACVDVMLATDVPRDVGAAHLAVLRARHPSLDLGIAYASEDLPSHCRNLVAGIMAARKRYVWIVDDDDYIDPMSLRTLGRYLNKKHDVLLFVDTQLHDEVWDLHHEGGPTLVSSEPRHLYPAVGWRKLALGGNTIPVCGFIAKSLLLRQALSSVLLRHDFSEDYALLLVLLTSLRGVSIRELRETLGHVSIRSIGENSATAAKLLWTKDIGNYLFDITSHSPKSDPTCIIGLIAQIATYRPDEA